MSLMKVPPQYRGIWTLFKKEVWRFWRVAFQTLAAPILTALLYLLIFSHVLEDQVRVYQDVPYTAFLIPGLMMMSMLQNAFANTSSSLIQSKVMGNLVFILLTPLSYVEIFIAFLGAAIIRGLAVGLAIYLVAIWFIQVPLIAPIWVLVFGLLGCALLGVFGMIAGIWAEKFDQMAVFQNFVIMPFTFLSGVFYSIHSLPAFWQLLSKFNPFFYMIDGFRYGFFGQSDVSPWLSLAVVSGFIALLTWITLKMLKSGYKLRG